MRERFRDRLVALPRKTPNRFNREQESWLPLFVADRDPAAGHLSNAAKMFGAKRGPA